MKTITKSVIAVLALMASVTTANAQDEGWKDAEQWVELTADMWHTWANPGDETTCTKEAVALEGETTIPQYLNEDRGAGSIIFGAENVDFNQYADLTDYDKLILVGSGGPGCRVMCNRIVHEGAWKNMVIGFGVDADGNPIDSHWDAELEALVIDLNEFKTMTVTANSGSPDGMETGQERVDDFVHLHCLKNAWGGAFPVQINAMYVWKAVGGTDGIKNVKTQSADKSFYNLNGQRVANPSKGLFIQNGKKIIMK